MNTDGLEFQSIASSRMEHGLLQGNFKVEEPLNLLSLRNDQPQQLYDYFTRGDIESFPVTSAEISQTEAFNTPLALQAIPEENNLPSSDAAMQVGPVIIAEGVITINGGGDFDGIPTITEDDALIYGGKGFSINGSPILPVMRDENGAPIVDARGLQLLVDEGLTVSSEYSVLNAPSNLYSDLKTPQIVDKRFVEVPSFNEIKSQVLQESLSGVFEPVEFNAFNNPLNSIKDWETYFPASGSSENPRVVQVISQGLNIPSGVTIENAIIFLESGDINFNGQNHQLKNVVLVAHQGSVNLSGVQAIDLTILAGRSINVGNSATFQGQTLFANGDTNGITFNSSSMTTDEDDFITIISQGRVNYNANSDIRGKILSVGDISFNSSVNFTGSVGTKGNIFFNGFATVQAIIPENIVDSDLLTAGNLGLLQGTTIINDFVGDSDPVDFFKFSVQGLNNLVLTLDNLESDVDVALVKDLNNNNQIDANEVGALSALEGLSSEKIDVVLTEGDYFAVVEQFEGNSNYSLGFSATEVIPFPETGQITLKDFSETAFNATSQPVEFQLSGIEAAQLPTVRVYFNDELITDSITITETSLLLPSLLEEGRNDILIYGVQNESFSLLESVTLWAGSESIEAIILDENGQPVSGAVVVAKLADDNDVIVQQITDNTGRAIFSNVPGRTILFEARDDQNNFDSVGDIGNASSVTLVLKGFDEPSPIDNNDFSLGLDGWDIGTAPVDLIPHQEPSFDSNILPLAQAALFSNLAVANAAQPDIDLVLNTSGEGEQTISRTFVTEPGIECITLRYQFITSEIPGGFFGTEFNDYFSVSIRSLQEGRIVSETNSMNGLGLSAFDASGATQFREVTLPVNVEGDTVQVDVTVANVADGALDSRVVIDSIDPSESELDYQDVDIEFKGFIPSDAVSLTNKTFSFIPLSIFGGDDRSFGGGGSSRFTQTVTVTADPDESTTVTPPERVWGATTQYSSSQGDQVDSKPFWWWQINSGEAPQAVDTLPVTSSNNNVTVERISADTVKVNLKISGSNPLQFLAPNLDAELDVFIRQQSPCHTPEYKVEGFLDGFPSYELFINGQSIFQEAADELLGPSALFPFLGNDDVSIEWQSVPS